MDNKIKLFLGCSPIEFSQETPFYLFKKIDSKYINELLEEGKDRLSDDDEKRSIICRTCQNFITSVDKKIDIDGSHIHIYKNPSGIVYKIGCFKKAKGCINTGIPTYEFTWFPGYKWSYALCSVCNIHLGWKYQSGNNSFFGLILDNLQETQE